MPLHFPALDAPGRGSPAEDLSSLSPLLNAPAAPQHALTDRLLVTAWARAHGHQILFVDANHFLLELTARAFRGVGASCRTAATHDEAVRSLEGNLELRAAVLDYELPEGDIAGLVRRMRVIRPSILLVGTSDLDRRREFARRGVRRFVTKPWRFADLVKAAALETTLAGARPARSA